MNYKIKVFIVFFAVISLFKSGSAQNLLQNKNDLTYVFIEALKSKTFGNYNQAAYLLQKSIDSNPNCAACYYELSNILFYAGDKQNAQAYILKAYNIDKSNYWYNKSLADICRYNNDFVNAKIYYEELLKKPESSLEDKFNYASVLFNVNKAKEGLKILDKIETENGVSEMISLARYKYFLNVKKYKLAENELEKLLKFFPTDINLFGMLAELYAIEKKDKLAIDYYNRLFKIEPYSVSGLLSKARFCSSRYDYYGAAQNYDTLFLSDSISYEQKMNALHEVLKEDKSAFSNRIYLKDKFFQILDKYNEKIDIREAACDYFEKMKNFDSALIVSKQMLKIDPNNGLFYDREFFYLNALGKYSEIRNASDSVIRKFDNHAFIYLISGIAEYQLNSAETAITRLKNGYNYIGDNDFLKEQYVTFLAESFFKLGKIDSAFRYFELAVNVKDPSITLLNNYAYYLAENNRELNKALSMSSKTIEKDPKNPTFLDTYAWIYYKLHDYKNALKYISEAVKYDDSHNNDVIEHYADILFCNDKKELAIKNWKLAITLGSDSTRIESKIAGFKCE